MGKPNWTISENPKNRRWYVNFPAGLDADSYPSVAELKDAALGKGIDSFSLQSDAALEKNLRKAADCAGDEFSFPVVIEPTFDVRIIVTPDKTSATLYIRKAADRRPLDLKLVSAALNASRLKGMDSAKIKDEINRFKDSPALELNDFVVANGTPASRGKDRELLANIDWMPEAERTETIARVAAYRAKQPQTEADRLFPVAEATNLARVEQHQIVYSLTPAETGADGTDVYGNKLPGLPGNDPFIQLSENVSIGATGFKAEIGGLLLESRTENCIRIRVVPHADGKATPVVSEDNMSVSLILESDEGAGEPLTAAAALDSLAKKGIQGKINRELIEQTVEEVRRSKKSAEIVVLKGKSPVSPGSSLVTWNAGSPLDAALVNIQEGDLILTAEKLSGGSDGVDVYGTAIKASSGESAPIPGHDDTIGEETQGSTTKYIAKKNGCLTLADDRLSVSASRELACDVDEKTGDIQFPGDLVVKGTIRTGRAVKAAGELRVEGGAEASLVSSDICVSMTEGIAGAGRGTVWAKQTIHLAFAENARLLAGQDITVDNYCFQCTVKTNGMVFMKGNPGVLLGGTIRASKGVEVYELGSEKTIRTSISFGQNYLVSDQIEVCEKESLKIRETIAKIDEEMKRTSATDPAIHELRRKKLEFLKRNEKLTVRIFTLKEQFETHVISHIRVENTVYPGVILESHGRYYEVREQKNHVIFTFDQTTGQIVCKPIDL
jgi:uncharacterized protein (DUF342 family)